MKIKAKFEVNSNKIFSSGGKIWEIYDLNGNRTGIPAREISMNAVCGSSGDPEDASFAQYTPSGNITFQLTNADLKDYFIPGEKYYVEFIKIEE